MRDVLLVLTLLGTWLLLSGVYEPLTIGLGVASCIGIVVLNRRLRPGGANEAALGTWLRILAYTPWIMWEIVKANIDVAKIVLNPKMPISPRLVRVQGTQKSDLGRTIYANSITLTPGTITLDVRGDSFLVHALTEDAAKGVETGDMDRKVTALEG